MFTLIVRNVHAALPAALAYLYAEGERRDSRNGPVLQAPCPVSTVYERPWENVVFWPERDANPFFHLYESLWMLAGRNDVAGVERYAKQMRAYSDDGETLHGAYGHRWRNHWGNMKRDGRRFDFDQLGAIAYALQTNQEDRRAVLAMWDPNTDLARQGKDVPCNLTATFQINVLGELDLVVFCRSNDIVWGAYGANAVHFSFLLSYLAHWIGVPIGTYTQVSVNWHGYLKTLDTVKRLAATPFATTWNPYTSYPLDASTYDKHIVIPGKDLVRSLPFASPGLPIDAVDRWISNLLLAADTHFALSFNLAGDEPFFEAAYRVLWAHELYKAGAPTEALKTLAAGDQTVDWIVSATEWIQRRVERKESK